MAYHEAFWVVVGTAAPVLALAHAVTFDRSLPLRDRAQDLVAELKGLGEWRRMRPGARRLGTGLTGAPFFFGALGFALSLTLVLLSLSHLASESDHSYDMAVAAVVLVLGFFSLVMQSVALTFAPRVVGVLEERVERAKRPQPSPRSPDAPRK